MISVLFLENQFIYSFALILFYFIYSGVRLNLTQFNLLLFITIVMVVISLRDASSTGFSISPYIRIFLFLLSVIMIDALFEKYAYKISLAKITLGIVLLKISLIISASFYGIDICSFTNCIRLWPTEFYRYANTYDITIASLLILLGGRYILALPIVFLISQTRLAVLFSVLIYLRNIDLKKMLSFFGIVVLFSSSVYLFLYFQDLPVPRVFKILDSSMSDKFAQYNSIFGNIGLHNIILGEGLSASLNGIEIRDVMRPYSYEAQLLALVIQGGLLFIIPLFIFIFVTTHNYLSLILYCIAGLLNPMMFVLSLYLILKLIDINKRVLGNL